MANYRIDALRARLADQDSRWSRAHVEGLINQIEELTKQRDEGWSNFEALRKRVAEEKYPGMTGVVSAHEAPAPVASNLQISELERKNSLLELSNRGLKHHLNTAVQMLRQYAGECAECHGEGQIERGHPNAPEPDSVEDCVACEEIRELIDRLAPLAYVPPEPVEEEENDIAF